MKRLHLERRYEYGRDIEGNIVWLVIRYSELPRVRPGELVRLNPRILF
jgi:hypothetical protein